MTTSYGIVTGRLSPKRLVSAEELPDPKIRAMGKHVLVLVEPLQQPVSEAGIELVRGMYDDTYSLGIGWVLSAASEYTGLSDSKKAAEKKWREIPGNRGTMYQPSDHNSVLQMPVKRGDKVCFRRFLRSQNLMQGLPSLGSFLSEYPDYELLFLHIDDIIGTVEDDTTGSTGEAADTHSH